MTDLKRSLETLISFEMGEFYVTSLYLKLSSQHRQNNMYLKIFKNLVRKKKKEIQNRIFAENTKKSIEKDIEKIESFLSDPNNLKDCGAISIFSCSAKNLFEVIKLPYVYRNRLMIAPDPLVREIVAIDEEFGKIAVLLVDRKHVRYFLMDIVNIYEKIDFLEPLATRSHRFHSGGAALKGAEGMFQLKLPSRRAAPNMIQHSLGEWRFHMRIKEEWHRILKIAADALFEDWKLSKFDKLIVGGLQERGLREIENHLHPYLRERLIGFIDVNPSEAKLSQIKEKAVDLLLRKDREEEKYLIEELEELQGKGLAVNGTSAVLDMVAIGNIRLLLVPEDFEKPGYLCPQTHLVFLKPRCPLVDEEPIPIEDIVDEVIEEALEQRAKVEVIVDSHLQKKIDGLAAFLRFSL